jgi:hypothetical protein
MPAIIPKPLCRAALPLAVLGAVAVGGCGALESSFHSSGSTQRLGRSGPQAQREATLGARWRGQPYDSLLQALGPPRLVMRIPGERPLPSLAVLYGREDETAACEDAFTLVQNEDTGAWSVADYFCR